MLNGKQRAALRAAANGLEAWFQIGKSGIGGNMTADISAALDAHELVKITVLKTAPSEPKTLLRTLAQTRGSVRGGQQDRPLQTQRKRGREAHRVLNTRRSAENSMREDKTKLTPENEPQEEPSSEALRQARDELKRRRQETQAFKRRYFDFYDDVKISHREDW